MVKRCKLTGNWEPKIIDMGMVNCKWKVAATPGYVPPESVDMVDGKSDLFNWMAGDMFAFGIVFF